MLHNVGVAGLSQVIDAHAVVITAVAGNVCPTGNMALRRTMALFNVDDTETIYIGDAGVTAAQGYPIIPGGQLHIDVSDDVDVFAITAAGVADVRILEIG